jgi:hypothetical protein
MYKCRSAHYSHVPRRSVPVTLEDVLTKAPLWEIQRQLAKYIAWSAFLARNAARIGAWIAPSVELSWLDNAVQTTITFRLQRTEVDERRTRAIMLTRLHVARRLLGHVLKMLEDEGIKVAVDERMAVSSSQVPEMVSATFVLRLLDVDAVKFLGKATKKWRIVYESRSTVGGLHVSTLKAEETSALIEYERGGEVAPSEEDLRAAAEGGGEEEHAAAGSDLIGPREAAERGYLRLSAAVLKYNVPLHVLMRLALDGRIEYRYGVDEGGAPAMYVREEEVREVAKYIRFEGKQGKEGEESGG